MGRARPVGAGQPEVPALGLALPTTPACYHVVQEAFVDRNEERFVGELIIQEVQEVETPRGGIGIAQQHLGRWGEIGPWAGSLPRDPSYHPPPLSPKAGPLHTP